MKLLYDKSEVTNWNEILSSFSDADIASPTCSTIPLLDLVKNSPDEFKRILESVGMPGDAALHFEYQVRSPKGDGKASHTDLMAIASDSSVAIEAKWNEPLYQTVGEWLEHGNQSNREAVLEGWLSLLNDPADHRRLTKDDMSEVTYQTVHRAASAASLPGSSSLAYLVFEPCAPGFNGAHGHYVAELTKFVELLGDDSKLPVFLINVTIERLVPPPPEPKAETKEERDALLAAMNRAALMDSQCFQVKEFRVQQIVAAPRPAVTRG